MSPTVFDTLNYVHKLKDVGVPEKQAETHARALADIIESNLATKHDIKEIERDIEEVRKEIEQIRRDMATKTDLEKTKTEIIKWVAGMIVAQAAIVAALVKLL